MLKTDERRTILGGFWTELHCFNMHHIEKKEKQKQSSGKENLFHKRVQGESNRCKQTPKLNSKIFQSGNMNIFESAISSINSYYEKIQKYLQQFQKQDINHIQKIRESMLSSWGTTKKTQLVNQIHTLKWEKLSIQNPVDLTKSPFLRNKERYLKNLNFLKNLKEKIKQKTACFPFVGGEQIRLWKPEYKIQINYEKENLKCLIKQGKELRFSNIKKDEDEKSSFVSKKAFRELFPQDQEENPSQI